MIQVIHRAFDILELVSKDPYKPKSLSEISKALNLNSGTCANIIKTMVGRRYLEKIEKKGYVLGSFSYQLGDNGNYKRKLIDTASPIMESLTKKLTENCELTVLQNNIRLVLLRVNSNHDLQVRPASERIAYDTASGRAMLAFLDESELRLFIAKYGLPKKSEWPEAGDETKFFKEISRIRSAGYSIYVTNEQIFGVAVPLFQANRMIAALGVYMPVFRYTGYDKNTVLQSVMKSAKLINNKL